MLHRSWKRRLTTLGGAFLLLLNSFLAPVLAAPPGQGTTDGQRIEQLLTSLSPQQKVAQLFMISLWGEILTLEGESFLSTYNPGGVILFNYNTGEPAAVTRLTNSIQQTSLSQPGRVPTWIAVDQEGGVVARLSEGFTAFPVNMAIAATGDTAYARAAGLAIAEELRAVGINMNLAPVADLETNPENPVIIRRAFGSDPQFVGEIVAATVEGMQAGGVLATAKHFPGHGSTDDDSHVSLPVVHFDRERLNAVELVPFQHAIEADVGAIMAAHIWFPALDPIPNTPASLSYPVLSELLRDELQFEGLVITDALDMDAIDRVYSIPNAAVLAVQAGADLIAPGPHAGLNTQREAIDAVVAAVESGEISIERIDSSVRRILTLKARYGVLDWTPLEPETATTRMNREAHEALVEEILSNAVTLVYDSQNLLPLDISRRIALVYLATRPSIARHCETYDDNLRLVGVSEWPTDEEIDWALSAANWADVTVAFTQDALDNTAQQRLVNALPAEQTVVVALRSPYDWLTFPNVAAYLVTYSPLQPVIPATCARLFGAQPITGVLPIQLSEALPTEND